MALQYPTPRSREPSPRPSLRERLPYAPCVPPDGISAVLRDTNDGRIGLFSADPISRHHWWQWDRGAWPATAFTLTPEPDGLPACPDFSDVFPVPPADRRRPSSAALTAHALYEVVADGRSLALLAVGHLGLHWIESEPGALESLGTQSVVFRPRRADGLSRVAWTRTQRPTALGATHGPWPRCR